MPKIFEGLRVLDCSQFISGPWTSIFFTDQGAEVKTLINKLENLLTIKLYIEKK